MLPHSTFGVFMKCEHDNIFFTDMGLMIITAVELPQMIMPGAGASHKAMDGSTRVHHKGDLKLDVAAVGGAELLSQLRDQARAAMQITVAIAILTDKFVNGKQQKVVAEIYELRGVTITAIRPCVIKQNEKVVYSLHAPVGSVFHIAFDPASYPSVEDFK